MSATFPCLVVVATAAEAERLRDLRADIVVSGVGPVAAALATAQALAQKPYALALSAGIAGGFAENGVQVGQLAVSSRIVQADLGAADGLQWLGLSDLGLSVEPHAAHWAEFEVWEGAAAWAERVGAAYGPMLTLSAVTGSAEGAAALLRRHPDALTEGMEGAGVAHAALRAGVPALEVRGVSNVIGPRDRSAWRIGEALAALHSGLRDLLQSS